MRKTITLLLLVLFSGLIVSAQSKFNPGSHFQKNTPKAIKKGQKISVSGFEAPIGVPAINNMLSESEESVGTTSYDQQSNSSIPHRVHNWGNGDVSASWIYSADLSGSFSERGMGYNKRSGGVFGPAPTSRVETVRTGFGSYFVTPNGEEWIVSHTAVTGGYAIHFAHKQASATTWTEGNLPLTTPNGGLWSRACAGGADGNTIHVIYLTTPTGFSGSLVDGLNGTIKYCRSSNNGASWDIIDAPLPGLNTDNYFVSTNANSYSLPAEGYSISANGDAVAIGMADFNGDCLLWKSNDNGANWDNPRVVNDFPLTKWDIDSAYTFDDIAQYYDPNFQPDSLAMLTSDETGTVYVDPDGVAHMWFSSLFIADSGAPDGSYSWWPWTNLGIIYWNELMADNAGVIAGYSPDVNGDGAYAWASDYQTSIYTGYGDAFCSQPTAGRDADGRLYVTFSSSHELAYNGSAGQYFHSPFVAASDPVDYTVWGEPKPAVNENSVDDLGYAYIWECYFPAMAEGVDDKVHMLIQQDFVPGSLVRSGATSGFANIDMLYLGVNVSDILSDAKEVHPAPISLAVMPNPVSDQAQIAFTLPVTTSGNIEIYNATGKLMARTTLAKMAEGSNVVPFDVRGMDAGIYVVKLNAGAVFATAKLLVVK